ncbi:hypothetical protein CRG98_013548 [Punica granatum]|uniref:C3H1-type domain-containing protein n=1 Tax=Punica granatum TaxID=22663 RepID=A0A2I0KD48_PUNGR|nr:hypothetical protein CRG98_013548 [Punica granatum]
MKAATAEHLASIFGTEKDRVNCPFYFKIGECRHGDRCSRLHTRPSIGPTLLLSNMYQRPDMITPGIDANGQPIDPLQNPGAISRELRRQLFGRYWGRRSRSRSRSRSPIRHRSHEDHGWRYDDDDNYDSRREGTGALVLIVREGEVGAQQEEGIAVQLVKAVRRGAPALSSGTEKGHSGIMPTESTPKASIRITWKMIKV